MNDFTKEELSFLYEAARHVYKQGIDLGDDITANPYEVMKKIERVVVESVQNTILESFGC